jgi:hypothetical protein
MHEYCESGIGFKDSNPGLAVCSLFVSAKIVWNKWHWKSWHGGTG